MCGIAGIADLKNDINTHLLESMGKALAHRGPDDSGTMIRNSGGLSVGFASRRLSIIDLTSAGHMPMANADETIWVTYNGEIYNHLEIREDLIKHGVSQFKSRADTETLLYAYQVYGLQAFEKFNGIFAAAIFDQRSQTFVLARDRMGVKPLYYFWDGSTLVFASELKAMLLHPKIHRHVDLDALNLYLALGYVPSPLSLIAEVHKLEPGNLLVLQNSRISIQPFWSSDGMQADPDRRPWKALVDETYRVVDTAVKDQLMSDVPVGVMLSGGLDSTIIAAAAKKYHHGPLHTFSVGFQTDHSSMETMYNWDRDFARSVAQQIGTEHHEVQISDGPNLIDQIETLIQALDEPLWEASYLSIYAMAQLARQQGIKVLLTGDGSDELFGGYPWYEGALRLAYYERLPFLSPLLSAASRLLPPGTLKIKSADLHHKYHQENFIKYIYNYQHFDQEARARLLTARQDCLPSFIQKTLLPAAHLPIADQFAYADLMLWVREHFNQRIDRMTMQASVEGRVPFQDNRVVDFALGVPMSRKIQGSVKKALLVNAFRGIIPENVIRRPKRPFAAPAQSWLLGALLDYAKQVTSETSIRQIGIIDGQEAQRQVQSYLDHPFAKTNLDLVTIWNLMAFCIWAQKYHITL